MTSNLFENVILYYNSLRGQKKQKILSTPIFFINFIQSLLGTLIIILSIFRHMLVKLFILENKKIKINYSIIVEGDNN